MSIAENAAAAAIAPAAKNSDAAPLPRRVLYVVSRFPNISTTFTTNEMLSVAAQGVQIDIMAIWKPLPGTQPHHTEEPLLKNILVIGWGNPLTWLLALSEVFRNPHALEVIARLLVGHTRSPILLLKFFASLLKGLALGRWCMAHQPDHIHAHFLTSPATVAAIASVISGIPYTYTAHAHDVTFTVPRLNGAVPAKCQSAAGGVAVSAYIRDTMLARWPQLTACPPQVIYNGVDCDLFQPPANRQFPHNADHWQIISVSRLVPSKGQDVLIQAVASLRQRGMQVELDIFGDGEEHSHLQQLIDSLNQADYIRLRGSLTQLALVSVYQQADIFALACVPTADGTTDGLPTVLIEALAAELPTVSTQLAGIPEIIEHEVTGLCVSPNDVTQLEMALEWLITHPAEALDMGRTGRQRVLKHFSSKKNAQKLLDLWQKIHR